MIISKDVSVAWKSRSVALVPSDQRRPQLKEESQVFNIASVELFIVAFMVCISRSLVIASK
jgi:hypothetical protein